MAMRTYTITVSLNLDAITTENKTSGIAFAVGGTVFRAVLTETVWESDALASATGVLYRLTHTGGWETVGTITDTTPLSVNVMAPDGISGLTFIADYTRLYLSSENRYVSQISDLLVHSPFQVTISDIQ
jgi:hypothetical protein